VALLIDGLGSWEAEYSGSRQWSGKADRAGAIQGWSVAPVRRMTHASVELRDVSADTGERRKVKTSVIPRKTRRKTAAEQRPKQQDNSAITAVITAA
jgi:hypothetical protein